MDSNPSMPFGHGFSALPSTANAPASQASRAIAALLAQLGALVLARETRRLARWSGEQLQRARRAVHRALRPRRARRGGRTHHTPACHAQAVRAAAREPRSVRRSRRAWLKLVESQRAYPPVGLPLLGGEHLLRAGLNLEEALWMQRMSQRPSCEISAHELQTLCLLAARVLTRLALQDLDGRTSEHDTVPEPRAN